MIGDIRKSMNARPKNRIFARDSQRGTSTTELALALPLLLVITLGLVDLGRAAYEAMTIDSAAGAGAAFALRSQADAVDATAITNAVLADVGTDLDTSKLKVQTSATCECSSGAPIDCSMTCSGKQPLMFVHVRVDKQFQTLISYPGMPKNIALAREAHMRVR